MTGFNPTPETLTTLLLCSNLGNARTGAAPIGPSEFSRLLDRLSDNGHILSDLTGPEGSAIIDRIEYRKINPDRLRNLLDRGNTIALSLETFTNKGISVISRLDEDYPEKLKSRLKHLCPPLLYVAGDLNLLSTGGLAVVGSRDVDENGVEFTEHIAGLCAVNGITVISGGARGVDQVAMRSALIRNGNVAGVLAANLMKSAIAGDNREAIMDGNLVLVSPYSPNAGFNIGNAMGRNKYIYALSDWGLVVSATANKGGTWAGAVENMGSSYRIPLFVRQGDEVPPGNRELIRKGGIPIRAEDIDEDVPIGNRLDTIAEGANDDPGSETSSRQLPLFD